MRKLPATVTLALGLLLTLAGCGSDESSDTATSLSTTEHNDTDVEFATEMIQHHAQALSMVDLTMGRDLDPEVLELADDIRAAQAPEIETMTDWLTEWDEDIPETVRDHANAGHDMGDMDHGDMPGMMSGDDMDALENASDAEFQDMWLKMMVEHHEGAVEMAEAEEADGQYKSAVELAKDIQETQTAGIEKMQGLLS
jgi:uncharacterized protein (DUF305 family)